MLLWVTIIMGFYLGGQISIIHFVNLFKSIFIGGGNMLTFFIEPIIFIFGIVTIVSLFFGAGLYFVDGYVLLERSKNYCLLYQKNWNKTNIIKKLSLILILDI